MNLLLLLCWEKWKNFIKSSGSSCHSFYFIVTYLDLPCPPASPRSFCIRAMTWVCSTARQSPTPSHWINLRAPSQTSQTWRASTKSRPPGRGTSRLASPCRPPDRRCWRPARPSPGSRWCHTWDRKPPTRHLASPSCSRQVTGQTTRQKTYVRNAQA